jgi:hypothetical protein
VGLLFFFPMIIELGSHERLVYWNSLWFFSYVISLSGTCWWFAFKLFREANFRWVSLVFLLIGGAFLANFLNVSFLWLQNVFDWLLPTSLALFAKYAPLILMSGALLLVWFRVSIQPEGCTRGSLAQVVLVGGVFLSPSLWHLYKGGLINFIIRAMVYWGLDYSGYGWFHVSFFLVAVLAYLLLIRWFKHKWDGSLASPLIFLGVLSFPWNGISVLTSSYSSIPGNLLAINALGFGLLFKLARKNGVHRVKGKTKCNEV